MKPMKGLGLPEGELYLMTEIVRQRERRLTNLLGPLGLTLHEWRALRILYSFTGDVPMSTIIAHSQTDRTALGRTLDRLVARGWVSRLPDPKDKRAVYLRVDPASRETFGKALKQVARLDEAALSVIGVNERAVLARALAKIVAAGQQAGA